MKKRVVLKVGSGVILKDGVLDTALLKDLTGQIATLRKRGFETILVSSGAVASGKEICKLTGKSEGVVEKQLFAAVGQARLMSLYRSLFEAKGLLCAQILVTKEDFRDREHYLNMKNCFEKLLAEGIVPVVNENDVVATTELIFTDNDELAGLVASQLDAHALIILTSVDGILAADGSVVLSVKPDDNVERFVTKDRSAAGRGGMGSKVHVARTLASEGITVHIINGKHRGSISKLFDGKVVGTTFIPAAKRVAARKRRVAHSDGFAKGTVYINECTEALFRSKKVLSLLPVGITQVSGTFTRGDLIEIKSGSSKEKLGTGIAQYDSKLASASAGKKGAKALVHYNYLFMGR